MAGMPHKEEKFDQFHAILKSQIANILMIVFSMLAAVLTVLSLAVHYHRIGTTTLLWARAPITGIQHGIGFAYIAPTDHPELSSDQHPSAARLFENGKPLPGPANDLHDDIRQIGQGRYSFWHDYVYFSASDNSDPRTNGRSYEFSYPWPISDARAHVLYYTTISVVILVAVLLFLWTNERMRGRWRLAAGAIMSWTRENKLAAASIFLFALSFGLTALFLAADWLVLPLPKFGQVTPPDLVWAGLILMVLGLAGLVRTETGWAQQFSLHRKLLAGLAISSITVFGSLLVVFLLPSSLTMSTRQLVFIALIGILTLSILLVRYAGWSGERLDVAWQASTMALRRVPAFGKAIDGCSSALGYVSRSTHWSGYLLRLVTFTLPFLAYAAVLASDIPIKIDLEVRTGTGNAYLLLFAVLLYSLFRRSGWWEDLGGLAVTLVLFALPLSGLWNSGYSNGSTIGGLLPWSDASAYYADANRLLEGGMMSAFSQRRPLFPGSLAAVLGLVHGNLAAALAVLGAIAILACFLLAREVRRSHGAIIGAVTLVVLFLFYRTYIGLSLTENLGIALGALALAILWRGASSTKMDIVLAGIFLLTMAMNARAGAFLVLPLLVLWGAWFFRGKSRISLRFFLGGCVAILLAFLLDTVLRHLIANSGGMAYGNFSYSLYGLVVGNKGFLQVGVDHPEVLAMNGNQLYSYIYQLAFRAFRADPMRAVKGLFGAWRDYLHPTWGAFSFVNLKLFEILDISGTRWALFALSGLGLLGCFWRWRDPHAVLVLVFTLGVLASVPFVPPLDADLMRAYAATIPLSAIWVALGLYTLFSGLKWWSEPQVPVDEKLTLSPLILGLAFALFCFLSPILVKGLSRPTQFTQVKCPSGLTTIYFRSDRSAVVNLVADDVLSGGHLSNIRLSDFRNQLHLSIYPELSSELNNLTAGQSLILGFDIGETGGSLVWLIADTSSLPPSSGIFRICARLTENTWLQQYRFYEVDTIDRIQGLDK